MLVIGGTIKSNRSPNAHLENLTSVWQNLTLSSNLNFYLFKAKQSRIHYSFTLCCTLVQKLLSYFIKASKEFPLSRKCGNTTNTWFIFCVWIIFPLSTSSLSDLNTPLMGEQVTVNIRGEVVTHFLVWLSTLCSTTTGFYFSLSSSAYDTVNIWNILLCSF